MPIRRARREKRDKLIREQAVRDYLGPNGKNLFPGIELSAGEKSDNITITIPDTPKPEQSAETKALHEKLNFAARLALEDAIETLEMKLEPKHPDFVKMKRLKAQAGATVAGILARVNPGDMRGQRNDRVGDILASLRNLKS